MKPGPALATRIIISTLPLDAPPYPIRDLVSDLILSEGWFEDSSVAREKSESWENDILNRLRNELNSLLEMGRPPRFTFNSSSHYMVQGFCFVEPHDDPEIKKRKERRVRADDYFSAIVALTSDEFECLCGKTIELFGVIDPVVTQRSADEGIDFYGKLSLESIFYPRDISPTIQKQLSAWVVGQAKRYIKIQSGTHEIRELVGSVILGRSNVFGGISSPYSDMEIRPNDPVFTILITSGSFSANASRLLRRSGVIGMDGEMLAAFLADREVGFHDMGFSEEHFKAWFLR